MAVQDGQRKPAFLLRIGKRKALVLKRQPNRKNGLRHVYRHGNLIQRLDVFDDLRFPAPDRRGVGQVDAVAVLLLLPDHPAASLRTNACPQAEHRL